MWETQVRSLGQEDPLEGEMATYSILLPGDSHGQRKLVNHSPWGHKELGTSEACTGSILLSVHNPHCKKLLQLILLHVSPPQDCEILEGRNCILLVIVSPIQNFFLSVYVQPDTVVCGKNSMMLMFSTLYSLQ